MDVPQPIRAAFADRYRIDREIGAGGMATVYLAEDVRHHRRVALKVLRPELAAVIGADRFLAEIRTTANLQHAHILPLFDSGEAERVLYYVMPFVEGESLRARLDRETQLPVDEAVRIAAEVASALDYAHSQGIIHRDIKPENILLQRGQALVADFGIALAVSAAGSTRMTETGLSLGTPHYMSPEQATAQREVDARCDIYSLGVVLYEMLTGAPPHTGSSAQAVLAALLTEEPKPVTTRRRTVPHHVAWAVHTALEKLPADRFRSAHDFAEALRRPELALAYTARGSAGVVAAVGGRRRAAALTAAAVVLLLGGLAAGSALHVPAPPLTTTRFQLGFAAGQDPTVYLHDAVSHEGSLFALSPDGRHLVYEGPGPDGVSQLWYRPLSQVDARPLPGTATGTQPFFAPDGRRIGFFSRELSALRTMALDAASPTTLASVPEAIGGSWGSDGFIYFTTYPPSSGGSGLAISRIAEAGGTREYVLELPRRNFFWPQTLPSGRGLLVHEHADSSSVAVLSFASGEVTTLARGSFPRYAAGYLFITRPDGVLSAAPFDERALRITGPVVPVMETVAGDHFAGSAHYAVADDGTLVHLEGRVGAVRLVRVARNGTERDDGELLERDVVGSALSPDGSKYAFVTDVEERSLNILDLASGARTRVTAEGRQAWPSWTPDSRHVTFQSTRQDTTMSGLYTAPIDGSAPATLTLRHTEQRIPQAAVWTPDGKTLIYQTRYVDATLRDIHYFEPDGDTTHHAVVATNADEFAPAISPDGRWLAYVSNESGRFEIHVRAFPRGGGRVQVSTAGGIEPRWSSDGTELFYLAPNDDLIAARVDAAGADFRVTSRTVLFSARGYNTGFMQVTLGILPGGREILTARREPPVTRAIVTLNWFEELKAKVDR